MFVITGFALFADAKYREENKFWIKAAKINLAIGFVMFWISLADVVLDTGVFDK